MGEIINQTILLCIGFFFSYFHGIQFDSVIPFLCTIIIAAILYLYPRYYLYSYLYIILCFQLPFIYYLPNLFYHLVQGRKWRYSYLLLCIPYLYHYSQEPTLALHFLTLMIAYILKVRYLENEHLKQQYVLQRDSTKELAILLESKNQDLMIRQEQEIKIATLNERNRIAREIHDHVGHLLSSSLLQIGALQAMNKQSGLQQPLQDLRSTISKGMDNVRSSVHNLHEDSVDLKMALETLCQQFTFCKAELEYDILRPLDKKIYYHILAIIKECFNNTMKHSNATCIQIVLREQPAFYQLIIHDNGNVVSIHEDGMGLVNIEERIHLLHGIVNISHKDGFRVFITLPKEE